MVTAPCFRDAQHIFTIREQVEEDELCRFWTVKAGMIVKQYMLSALVLLDCDLRVMRLAH